jgi:hypothetical protein
MPVRNVVDIKLDSIKDEYISRYLGYDDSHPPSELSRTLIDAEKGWLLGNTVPRGVYGIFRCELPDADTSVIGGKSFHSKVLRMHMEGSIAAAVMAVTVGPEVDERISGFMNEGKAAQGYIMNGVAAAAADTIADAVEEEILKSIEGGTEIDMEAGGTINLQPGWKCTLRFSPGYADFILENQGEIFDLVKPGEIGLNLTKSCLMVPMKSITAVIGIGPGVNSEGYPCDICDRCNITGCKYFEGL